MLGNKAKSHSTYTRDNIKRINMVGTFKDSIDGLTDVSQDNRINNFRLRDVAGVILPFLTLAKNRISVV